MKQIFAFATLLYTYILAVIQCSDNSNGYPCNIDDCQICSGPNFCGLCKQKFILDMDYTTGKSYCLHIQCDIPHCQSCLQFNQCETCASGYSVSSKGTCVSSSSVYQYCSENCLSCESSTQCTRCQFGYNLQQGECQPNNGALVPNCQSTFTGFTCQLCQQNYMVDPSYQCTRIGSISCNVSDCYYCQSSNYCSQCNLGYQLNNGNCESLTCGIDYCHSCDSSNTQICDQCFEGYELNEDQDQCVPKYWGCNVENCKICMENEKCSVCEDGYSPLDLGNEGNGSICVQNTQSTPNSLNIQEIFYYPVNNCQKFGSMIYGTSILQIGCLICEDGFLWNAGYCVANISLQIYQCSIPNCAYCAQNNYCVQCQDGYISYMGNYQKCIPYYSGQRNCKLTALFSTQCAICDQGYTLYGGSCVKSWDIQKCNIEGCEYCLEQNVCYNCRDGFNQNNSTCTPECDIDFCWQCASSTECQICFYGYYTSDDMTQCLPKSDSTTNCSQQFSNCANCTKFNCNSCVSGYTLCGGVCKQSPSHDVLGCAVYQNECSNICIQCQIGFNLVELPFFNFSTQCLNVPCGILNCAFCNTQTVCGVCMQNYTVAQNGSCIAYQPSCDIQNCLQCDNSMCTKCLSGYQPYQGKCVCPFQNCLKCMGDAYCTICAYPMAPEYGINTAGCLPEPVPMTNCNISNCAQCQNQQYCAFCQYGYSLNPQGTCSKNQCPTSTNCELCGFNNTQCYLCKPGFYQESYKSNQCNQIPSQYSCNVFGCQLCETSNSSCYKCYDLFYKGDDGLCHQNGCVDNCLVCYDNNTCSVCLNGFYRSKNSRNQITCQPINSNTSVNCSEINYCIRCQKIFDGQQCLACYPGLMPNSDGSACVPQVCNVDNCQLCMPGSQQACLYCKQGYYLNPYYVCDPYNVAIATSECDVYNCLVCGADNVCTKCLIGWNRTQNGTCVTDNQNFCQIENCGNCTYQNICFNCVQNYQLVSNSKCSPQCNIENCQTCKNLTACLICSGDLIPSSNKSECVCPDTYNQINNTYCVCPTDFTPFEGTCYNCSTPGNCSVCSNTNECQICEQTFKKDNNGNCVCPDDTFTFTNNSCQCLNGTTLYQETCVPCFQDCLQCSSEDYCINCKNNLQDLTNNGSCQCAEDFTQDDDDFCVCSDSDQKPNAEYTNCYPCDIGNCQFCSGNDTCSDCVSNYTLINSTSCQCTQNQSDYNGYCYNCDIQNCISCRASNYCYQCQDDTFSIVNGMCVCPTGYNLYNGSCVQCNVSNCSYCQQANICYLCEPTYYLTDAGACLRCNINNCIQCNSPGICSTCNSSLSLSVSSEGNTCLKCNIDYCTQCYNNGSCAICNSGYFLAANTITCVKCQLSGCATCKDDNVCSNCLLGYDLDESTNTCSICSFPCLSCNDNGCATCQSPYSLNANSQGNCFTCTVKNCISCNSTQTSQCLTCKSGYTAINGSCVYSCKDSNCLECFYNNICTLCTAGYAPNGTTGCKLCQGAPSCLACSSSDTSVCEKCAEGFYINSGKCMRCPYPYCKTCNQQQCLTFRESTGLISLQVDSDQIYPVVCDPQCATCSQTDPTYCLTCPLGFSNNKGQCRPCGTNCRSCSISDPFICYSCFSNANLFNNLCESCSGNCLTCTLGKTSECKTCLNGFYLGTDSSCSQSCPELCKTCTNQTYCTSCIGGYAASSNGTCLPCLSNCRQCAAQSPSTCLQCGDGFYLTSSQVCSSCSINCKKCNQAGCLQCSPSFTLSNDFECTPTCLSPCLTCSSTDPQSCFNCITGYKFNSTSGKCMPSPLVIGTVTYYCAEGSVLFDNQCLSCLRSTCSRCKPDSLSECTGCIRGYYLNNENLNCSTCPTGCTTCSDSNNCQSCDQGYVLSIQSSQSSSVCQACQSPCATCFNIPQTCSSCVEGYALSGWKCVTTFNIGFSLTLDSTMDNFDEVYYQFLLALTSALNSSDINIIQMNLLNSGSVITSGKYSMTTSPKDSSGQYTSIQSLLSKDSKIAGMEILSSKVTVNGGDIPTPEPDDNSSPNLGLILGICIPVGVILIGILVYCLCIRKRASHPPVDYTVNSKNSTVRQTFQLTREDPM